ncbi:UNVERIFIED_CONTAM: hypothetical protein FKN15_075680 [Acipenser sinensis]
MGLLSGASSKGAPRGVQDAPYSLEIAELTDPQNVIQNKLGTNLASELDPNKLGTNLASELDPNKLGTNLASELDPWKIKPGVWQHQSVQV